MRIGLLAISGWVIAAVLTVVISSSAISVVRDSVVKPQAVATALPAPDETASTAPTTARPTPKPTTGTQASKSGTGGTVTAACTNGRPKILQVIPRQPFTAAPDDSGAEVKFNTSDHTTQITVSCTGNIPQLSVEEKATGGGGDDNGGGSGRGGGGGGSGRGGGNN